MSSGPVHALILTKGENMDDESPDALTEMIDPVQVDLIRPKHRWGTTPYITTSFACDIVFQNFVFSHLY